MMDIETLRVRKMSEDRSILLSDTADGEVLPVCVRMTTREASSAPEGTRIKCSLVVDATGPEDAQLEVQMPFAMPTMITRSIGPISLPPSGMTPEFRLEMN